MLSLSGNLQLLLGQHQVLLTLYLCGLLGCLLLGLHRLLLAHLFHLLLLLDGLQLLSDLRVGQGLLVSKANTTGCLGGKLQRTLTWVSRRSGGSRKFTSGNRLQLHLTSVRVEHLTERFLPHSLRVVLHDDRRWLCTRLASAITQLTSGCINTEVEHTLSTKHTGGCVTTEAAITTQVTLLARQEASLLLSSLAGHKRRGSRIRVVEQVDLLSRPTAQVGNTADGTTHCGTRSERVDKAVECFVAGQVLARQTHDQTFLDYFGAAFEDTTHTSAYRATAQQLSTTPGYRCTGEHGTGSTHVTQHATSQHKLRQRLSSGVWQGASQCDQTSLEVLGASALLTQCTIDVTAAHNQTACVVGSSGTCEGRSLAQQSKLSRVLTHLASAVFSRSVDHLVFERLLAHHTSEEATSGTQTGASSSRTRSSTSQAQGHGLNKHRALLPEVGYEPIDETGRRLHIGELALEGRTLLDFSFGRGDNAAACFLSAHQLQGATA